MLPEIRFTAFPHTRIAVVPSHAAMALARTLPDAASYVTDHESGDTGYLVEMDWRRCTPFWCNEPREVTTALSAKSVETAETWDGIRCWVQVDTEVGRTEHSLVAFVPECSPHAKRLDEVVGTMTRRDDHRPAAA